MRKMVEAHSQRTHEESDNQDLAEADGLVDHLEAGILATDRNTDIEEILSNLSLDDKLSLLTGASLWKLAKIAPLTQITVGDGPHGIRKPITENNLHESFPATCFPTAAALACSWNEELCYQVGTLLQEECLHYNIQVLLGPGMNLKRHPAGGRTFEYWSEDPLLTGRLAAAYIRGVQLNHRVGVSAKHYCVNNQESHRFVVNAVVDERTIRELYLRHFEHVVKHAQPATVMCAYNKVNGVYCSEHVHLITNMLREEFGFQGTVITDWGAANDRVAGIIAGVDLEMPGSHGVHDSAIEKALEDGTLQIQQIDACCRRTLQLIQRYQDYAFEMDQEAALRYPIDWKAHYDVAHQCAMESAVLLRNEDNFLPLKKGIAVAVIGDFAKDHPRYQGMGSSCVLSQKVVTVYDELERYTTDIRFAPGYLVDDDHPEWVNQELIDEAVECARTGDVVLLCIGLPEIMESEGFDRTHAGLPAQHNALVEAVSAVNPNVVVILSNGGMIELPWYHKVKSILEGYLLGEAGGGAIVDLMFGLQSPSGKLAETFPIRLEDIPANQHFPGSDTRVEYREGLNVGYRYFDSAVNMPVRYPFGHGLSYTTFSYQNLLIKQQQDETNTVVVDVSFQITNTGSVTAKEVAQCYVHDVESSVYRPAQELKAFTKVELKPGETRTINMRLDAEAFSFYDIGAKAWVVEKGLFEIRIGSSSRDIRLREQIDIQTKSCVSHASRVAQESYPPVIVPGQDVCPMDDLSFAKRFIDGGSGYPSITNATSNDASSAAAIIMECIVTEPPTPQLFHRNTLLKEISGKTLIGSILMKVVYREASRNISKGPHRNRQQRMVRAAVENLPLRVLVLFSQGNFNFELLDSCLLMMNGFVLAALGGFCRVFVNALFSSKKRKLTPN